MLSQSIDSFISELQGIGGRLAFWNADGCFQASHTSFDSLAVEISELPDFREHQAAFFQVGARSGYLHSAFLHRTKRGPGAGGVRRRLYPNLHSLVDDGLRLAIGMGYKNALAGLWWGGGKGVIGCPAAREVDNATVYQEFGDFMSSLNGCYVTAEDVGTKPQDMATIFTTTRFTTCIPGDFGGSGNPSPATARGVFVGMQAVLKHLGHPDFQGTKVALQGLGEVGFRLAELLHQAGANMVVYDPEQEKVESVLALSPRHEASTNDRILTEKVDLLSPCALGAILSPETIPHLQCRAICGAANNQLIDETRDSKLLHERGILYIPDFIVNRMGIVQCADEQYGRLSPDPAVERHLGWDWEHAIGPLVLRLLKQSAETGAPPLTEAAKQAEAQMKQEHPIWPGRAEQIAFQTWDSYRRP